MGDPVVHFEIVGKDAAALRTFYGEAFGWAIGEPTAGINVQDYAYVHPNDRVGVDGGIGTAPQGYGGHCTFYVGVTDIAASLRKIESLGGSIMMEPQQVPDGPVVALFEDLESHVVGLVEIPKPKGN